MSVKGQGKRKISRSAYWYAMLVNMVACLLLLIGGLFMIGSGSIMLGIVMLVAIVPVGIYFRVAMMRRCRDIGWPAFLPWALFGAGIAAHMVNLSAGAGDPITALTTASLPLLIGLADFIVMLVVGAMPSKERANFGEVLGDDRVKPSRLNTPDDAPDDDERAGWDSAIERALKKQADAAAAPQQAAIMPQPSGFGRKGL